MAKASKAKVESKKTAATEAPVEAAPASVNKAQAVRDALAKNPKGSPKEIAAAMTEQGVTVAPSYVSLIKWQLKRKKKGKKSEAATEATTKTVGAQSGTTITIESLIQAKKLADALGGVEIARKALNALSRLA